MVTFAALFKVTLEKAPSPFEAGELFRFAAGSPIHSLDHSAEAPPGLAETLASLLERRANGEPLQYLLGEWEFYSLPIKVGPGALIPRQDTETLVDAALSLLKSGGKEHPVLLDLCSGTGCVALAIGHNFPGAEITALELSPQAYRYLVENIAASGQAITPVLGDLREYIHPHAPDMIVSNPPYIPRRDLAGLQPEVRREPVIALDGGEDGLSCVRDIAGRFFMQLCPGGSLLLEIGAGQEKAVTKILRDFGYENITERRDLSGIIRVVEARTPSGSKSQ